MSKPTPKPLFLIKPGTISKADIARAERHAGVCIVECTEPSDARFLVPPPIGDIGAQADAAMKVLHWICSDTGIVNRNEVGRYFTQLLTHHAKPVAAVKK